MKLFAGVSLVMLSLGLVLICKFLHFELIFDKFLGFIILIVSLLSAYNGVNLITQFFDYNRIITKGLKVKAHIIEVKRTLLNVNHLPEYIVEVIYKHPDNNKQIYTEFEYLGELNNNTSIQKGKDIDILIDPQNPENIYFKNAI